jgi:hypothetical protein
MTCFGESDISYCDKHFKFTIFSAALHHQNSVIDMFMTAAENYVSYSL